MNVLIDGNNVLAANVHANSTLATSYGFPTGGVYGTIRKVRSIAAGECGAKPSRILFCLDAGRPAFRNELLDGGYKSSRDNKPDDGFREALTKQRNLLRKILPMLNVPVVTSDGFEADDVLAGLARIRYADEPVVVVSGDKDMWQLISRNVKVYMPIKHKFADKPERGYLLCRTIEGDTSDCIPGVPGLGPVRAREVVNAVLEKGLKPVPSSLKGYKGKHAEKIKEHLDTIRRNWQIMNLKVTQKDALDGLDPCKAALNMNQFIGVSKKYQFNSFVSDSSRFFTPFLSLSSNV